MRRNTAGLLVAAVAFVTLAFASLLARMIYESTKVEHITVAAGSSRAESYILMQALKSVVELHYPHIRMTVIQTGGTAASLAMLDHGEAQLAPAQSDGKPGASARTVAVLFEDKFQLLVQKGKGVQQFTDLVDKNIALPTSGGQYESFLFLASHYGLDKTKFHFVGADEEDADAKFSGGLADAIFKVRGVPNGFIQGLVLTGKVEFLPIDEVEALQVEQSAYVPRDIPKGAYSGMPAVPPSNLHTVGLARLLMASQDVSGPAIYSITEVLSNRRQEIAAAIASTDAKVRPLLAGIRKPTPADGLSAAIHPGALAFYDGQQVSFIGSHPDLIALFAVIFGLIWLWGFALRRLSDHGQKTRINEFQTTVLQLIEEARASDSERRLEPIRAELMMIMTAAIRDLGNGRISEKSFQSFRVIWQVAIDSSNGQDEKRKSFSLPIENEVKQLAGSNVRAGSSSSWWKLGTP